MLNNRPQAICSVTTAEELGWNFVSPLYNAVRSCFPGVRVETAKVAAALLFNDVVDKIVPPSRKVIEPVGISLPELVGVTVLLSETDSPNFAGFGVATSNVVVDTCTCPMANVAEELLGV